MSFMEPASDIKTPILIGIGVLIVIVGAIALFFLNPTGEDVTEDVPVIDAGPDVSVQVSSAVETPAEKLPQTNPFTDYKNPFE